MKELLEDIQSTLQHIVDSDAWDMLEGSSAETLIGTIDEKLDVLDNE